MNKLLVLLIVLFVSLNSNSQTNSKKAPSLKELETIYRSLINGEKSALKNYGFVPVDKKTQISLEDIDGEKVKATIVKDVYILNSADGLLTAVNVYYSDILSAPELTIICNSKTWNKLAEEYDGCSDESIAINLNYEGVVRLSNDSSPCWPWLKQPLSFIDLLDLYNERLDRDFVNQQLAISGLFTLDNIWRYGIYKFEIDANNVTIETDEYPALFNKWLSEIKNLGYKAKDSGSGNLRRIDYLKEGAPMISYAIMSPYYKLCIGGQAQFE